MIEKTDLHAPGELDLHLIGEGRHEELWTVLGAQVDRHRHLVPRLGAQRPGGPGRRRVGRLGRRRAPDDAPRRLGRLARPRRRTPASARSTSTGIRGADGQWVDRADPMAQYAEKPPSSASVVWQSQHQWNDDAWLEKRRTQPAGRRGHVDLRGAPRLVAQALLRRASTPGTRSPTRWCPTSSDLGFTHVEFMPVMQHPFGGSWGYHVTSYFAADARFGDPDGLKRLIDRLHQAGVGVILDWVPGHFATDEWALARFDGTPLYEDPNPQRGWHKEWGSHIFNFGRNEVRNFLYANAVYWLEEYHADGLRVDGVASMLYLDYAREHGEWSPNKHGGRENLEAVQFLQEMNATVYKRVPGIVTIAEESTAWPGVTGPHQRRRPGLRLQVEHGLDARLARLRRPGPALPQPPPRPDDVLARLRLRGELRPADQPRRGRPRQGLAAAQDAGRPLAAAGQPARLPRLHVGPPRQAAALHGLRVRPGVRVGGEPRARLVAARAPRARRRPRDGPRHERHLRRDRRAVGPRQRPVRVLVDRRQRRGPQHLLVRAPRPGPPRPGLRDQLRRHAARGLPARAAVGRPLGRGAQHRRRDLRRLGRGQPRLDHRRRRASTTGSRRTPTSWCRRSRRSGSARPDGDWSRERALPGAGSRVT